ncbi:FUSC family protein [Phytopseudomonas dryadis]|uniref:Fusaric acid resistance protein n=1 Tax=Phytopseudomonas dryadis TaxID=2487520 RepID=A0ABY1Z291_9GAMM|nr:MULTISPECIES: FUSC family protein [Pseudomonas]TBV00380.1 fusaric acid resistance protein [Pseudomonas dryadis]TBV12950.1 fusaric acid resistance protein [Pseudomonas sp. FRB 230]
MRDALLAFLAPSPQALQFAIKTLLGGGLALWCAMRFGLEQPQWALMTAFIVAQPLSGMVVQKGLARLLGTLVGTCMAVLFMGLFAQAPWLFIGAMALWLGLCTAASTMLRSAWSYAFVLAGYTVAIIALPILHNPLLVFEEAIARCTEISLGIVCATLVSALLWPQRVERQLSRQARDAWQAGVKTANQALSGEPQPRQGLLEVLGRIVAVDAQREHAWFEGNRGRQRAVALRVLSRDLLGVLRLARGAARQWQQLREDERQALAPWLQHVRQRLDDAESEELPALAGQLREVALQPGWAPVQQFCLERLALLLLRVQTARVSLLAVEQGAAPLDAPAALSWHRDWQSAAVYGARSALTFLALSAFWLASAWTSASGALLLGAVVCSLFASRETAPQIGMMFLRGILYALPVAFIVGQVLLPQLSGFVMLCLVLGVPLFFGALGMAKPALGATSTAFCLHLIVLCAPQNVMRYDVALFINEAMAMLLGVACAVLAFHLVTLRNPVWHGRRLLRAIQVDLGRLTRRPLRSADNWFGGRMADRLLQLARHYPALPDQARSRWDDGVASLDLGDELVHLRGCLAAADVPLGMAEERFLRHLESVLLRGPAAHRAAALDAAVDELLLALRAATPSIDRRLAQAALLQLQSGWRHWCALQGERHGTA